jgi:CCR4-NOT transcription complex subunit 6
MKQVTVGDTRGGETVSLLSYNILADGFAPPENFPKTQKHDLLWTTRAPRLLNEIQTLNADVICVQEMEEYYFSEWLKPLLYNIGYSGVFVKKVREKGDGSDGSATFYRQSKFTLVQTSSLDYTEYARSMKQLFRDQKSLDQFALLTHSIALFTLLKTTRANFVWIVNTHLTWHYTVPHVQLFQAKAMMNELQRLNQYHHPYLLCGDYNIGYDSPVFEFLKNGGISHKSDHYTRLKSSYDSCFVNHAGIFEQNHNCTTIQSAYGPNTIQLPFSCHDGEWYGVLDHIWYNSDGLHLCKLLKSLEEQEIVYGLPNELHPSDHLPVMAEFEFIQS